MNWGAFLETLGLLTLVASFIGGIILTAYLLIEKPKRCWIGILLLALCIATLRGIVE